jgi:hypothetical protein
MRAIVLLSIVALSGACASTHDEVREQQAQQARAEFDQIKALAGGWSGNTAHGGESQRVEVTYRLTAGGNAVLETLFPGTEHEMVTLYYVDADQLQLTHYCVVGNQPHMLAKPGAPAGPEGTTIAFECHGPAGNMASEDDAHMHMATLEILSNNHIRTTWQMFEKQKPTHVATFDLTRDYTQS